VGVLFDKSQWLLFGLSCRARLVATIRYSTVRHTAPPPAKGEVGRG
jgi:hypothetical protein